MIFDCGDEEDVKADMSGIPHTHAVLGEVKDMCRNMHCIKFVSNPRYFILQISSRIKLYYKER
jgi:hypothetical protein